MERAPNHFESDLLKFGNSETQELWQKINHLYSELKVKDFSLGRMDHQTALMHEHLFNLMYKAGDIQKQITPENVEENQAKLNTLNKEIKEFEYKLKAKLSETQELQRIIQEESELFDTFFEKLNSLLDTQQNYKNN